MEKPVVQAQKQPAQNMASPDDGRNKKLDMSRKSIASAKSKGSAKK